MFQSLSVKTFVVQEYTITDIGACSEHLVIQFMIDDLISLKNLSETCPILYNALHHVYQNYYQSIKSYMSGATESMVRDKHHESISFECKPGKDVIVKYISQWF